MPSLSVNTRPLTNLIGALRAGSADPALGNAYRQWGRAYLTFAGNRFAQQESGGWTPLAPSTVRDRIRKGYGGAQPILRRTGQLRAGLRENAPGNVLSLLPNGVRTGYGGGTQHAGSRLTIAELAAIHNAGTGRIPQREIIVPPDEQTIRSGIIPPYAAAIQSILTR